MGNDKTWLCQVYELLQLHCCLNEFRSFLEKIMSRGLDLYEQKIHEPNFFSIHSLLVVGEGHQKVVKINGG
jgi:hypothetical protein